MEREEWVGLFDLLGANQKVIRAWPAADQDPSALRCEHSRHRTLAHLRACQEQWLQIVEAFAERDNPRVKVLHPWRQFDAEHYERVDWGAHMEKFLADRAKWLALEHLDWNRAGKWNTKPDTLGGLTRRLANHEVYHIQILREK